MSALPMSLFPVYQSLAANHSLLKTEKYQILSELLRQRLTAYCKNSFHFLCIDGFIPDTGDSGSFALRNNLNGVNPDNLLKFYILFKDESIAQMLFTTIGATDEQSLKIKLFQSNFISVRSDIEPFLDKNFNFDILFKQLLEIMKNKGPYQEHSHTFPGRGYTIGKSGIEEYRRALWMHYGDNTGHNHRDTLTIGLFAFGLNIIPNTGYPSMAENDRQIRADFWDNTISHATVTVNGGEEPSPIHIAQQSMFSDSPLLTVYKVDGCAAYPQLRKYERTTAMVSVNKKQFYVIDFFSVSGGNEHVYNAHAGVGDLTIENVVMKKQEKGTYAGEDVPYGALGYRGYQYLYDTSRGKGNDEARMVWKLSNWNSYSKFGDKVRLRYRIFSPSFELATGKGKPPQNRKENPEFTEYALIKNTGKNIDSHFVSVIECYLEGENPVLSVKKMKNLNDGKFNAALEITLADGRQDIIICQENETTSGEYENGISLTGQFALMRFDKTGKIQDYHISRSKSVKAKSFSFNGIPSISSGVKKFDSGAPTNLTITLADYISLPDGHDSNNLIVVFSPTHKMICGLYKIQLPANPGKFNNISLGDMSFIVDVKGDESGYNYAINQDAKVTIPITYLKK